MRRAAGRFLTRSIWISGVLLFCYVFFFLLLEPRRTCVCANMVCLLTSAVLQEPDRNKLGDPDFPSDFRVQSSSVLLVLLCLEHCRPTAQPPSLMHVSQVKTTAFKQNLNDLLLVTDVIQEWWWGGRGVGGLITNAFICCPAPPNPCVSYYLGDIWVPIFLLLNLLKL